MPDPDKPPRHDESSAEHMKPEEPSSPVGDMRTLTAGRAFLSALRVDLATLGRRLGNVRRAAAEKNAPASPLAGGRKSTGGTFRRAVRELVKGFACIAILSGLMLAGAIVLMLHNLPTEKPIGGTAPSLLMEAANGESLGRVGPLKMTDATRQDFPDNLVKAVTSVEDRHFYSHWGFDPGGILRALRRDIAAGSIVEGGSTITQQLAKMRFLGHERTLPRKLREAIVAVWLEMHLSKDEILTRYLNSVYLGNEAYGMSAAARLYFDKRPSELTLPEAAMLAGMIRSPSRINPLQNLEEARTRAAVVIDAMRDNGAIDAATAQSAKANPAVLHLSGKVLRASTWLADWVGREATKITSSSSGNVRLRTTLVPELQKLAEHAVDDILADQGVERHVSQAALVAMRPDGAVVAMVGGRDYQQPSPFNRAVDAQRQPGSAFKLFVYLAALRRGFRLNDTIDARSLDIKGWQPENFGDHHYGRVTLAEAFAESINTAAVRLGQQVGLDQVIAAARDLGITGALPAVPSLALGTADVSLLDLTAAYAAVRAGKAPIKPWGIAGISLDGRPQLQSMGPPVGPTQSLQPQQGPLLELLQDVVQRGTGRKAMLDGFAAGKTGTSQNYRDAWFIGFDDSLVTGVWVGNDDDSPTDHVTGGSLPAAIWKRFMTDARTVVAQGRPNGESVPDTLSTEAPAEQASESPQCDYQACARHYQSFRASDCTYQPYGGSSRRLCERNAPSSAAATSFAPDSEPQLAPSQLAPDKSREAQCNIDVCASFYDSFDPADCTYQPYGGGPRRVCDR